MANTFTFLNVNIKFWVQSSHRRCSVKKVVLKIFAISTGRHLCWRHFFIKAAGLKARKFTEKKLQHECFPVNIAKFYEHLFRRTSANGCFCKFTSILKNITIKVRLRQPQKIFNCNFGALLIQ